MIVGILKEIKPEENRVCHDTRRCGGVETEQPHRSGGTASPASAAVWRMMNTPMHGGEIVATPEEVFRTAEMVMHVKEPLPPGYDLIREGQIVFTYLHLAAAEELTRKLVERAGRSISPTRPSRRRMAPCRC
jgi:alanine dehydrogenase